MARVVLGEDDDEITVSTSTGHVETFKLHQLQPNPENPRPSDLEVDETAEDLRARGQLQNLNVMSRAAFLAQKPYLEEQLDQRPVVVINGCRRLAAGKKAGLPTLDGRRRDDWTEAQIDEAMITENVHRRDLNPLLLGRHLSRMLIRYGSQRKLAKGINKDPAWVRQRIDLTKLHPDLQAAIEADRVLFKVARECGRLHEELQPLLATGELPESVAQVWLTDERISADEQLARWKAGPPYLAAELLAKPDEAGEYPVLTPHESEEQDAPEQAAVSDDLHEPDAAAESEYPVLTPGAAAKCDEKRLQPQLIIRVEDRSPRSLADALREHLTPSEVEELVEALIG
ncbi:ParB/RepB/Spo0J family partition protein [Saccharopolyspora pogona]|uniref:ParB/RepB/Spo0J family partition protein n=1 Tax=Saccharopolyspora pogona TaxID=333966 RepID=UPI001684E75C|nr:ParB N-terminal domain-containing protein [Saccharopolyspora pogona]